MIGEQAELVRRARVHAALGDPARLAIVDTLIAGDAAPGELATALDLPTNLLAHHLKVLQDAGVVIRSRSEGDRRRTYVRLISEALESVAKPSLSGAPRLVFVCTRNSARSQLAAAIWSRRSRIPALSAGTRPAEQPHPRAVRAARRHGLDPGAWRTHHVNDVVETEDLVIAVCDLAYEQLPPGARPRLHWSVPDPAAVDTDTAFEAVYTELADRIERLAPVLVVDERAGTERHDTTASSGASL